MFNVREIVRNNHATFYDFETRNPRGQTLRLTLFLIAAILGAIFCPKVSDNLLAGFLAVQSILLGFTVNVMFFLLSNRERDLGPASGASMEAELRSERLTALYHELFYNVSYFNMLAVGSIIIAAALLLPLPTVPEYLENAPVIRDYLTWLETSSVDSVAREFIRGATMFLFYALALEAIFSILRIIGRTSFYFERKLLEIGTRSPRG